MDPGDLVKISTRIVDKHIRQADDIGIIVEILRMEQFGPPDFLVMWSSNEITVTRGYQLELVEDP